MTKMKMNKLISTIQKGQKVLNSLTVSQKDSLEKIWDVEHAYYSSALEGSHIDRKKFEKFAEKVD